MEVLYFDMEKKIALKMLIFLIIFSIFIAGCRVSKEDPVTETEEEVVDTGILVVESSPNQAQFYVDG